MSNGKFVDANNKPLGAVLHEVKDDLKEFLETRYEMLAGEVREKVTVWKTSLPMLGIALVLGATAFLCITFAIIAALRPLFDGDYAWAIAAVIVAVGYLGVAGAVAWLADCQVQNARGPPRPALEVVQPSPVL